MNYSRYALLFALLIGGCAQVTERPDRDELTQLWLEHQQQVGQITNWDINGRIGIRTAEKSGTASLFWRQQGASYEMRIVAPFGQGTYILTGSPSRVQMSGPDELLLTAGTAEELMLTGLGWSVDLQGLRYWVRGLPQPENAFADLELDGEGRLDSLRQSGFNIDIERYATVETYTLPEKLLIKNGELQLKVLINQWQI